MTDKIKVRNSFLLVLASLIWGGAFVAQRKGGDAAGPFTFNGIRSIIGGTVLLPVIFLKEKYGHQDKNKYGRGSRKTLLTGGICCGIVLFLASTTQQLGISMGTPAGKAGFLTACYILIVPVLGLFFKKSCSWNVWTGIIAAVAGLYLLCIEGSLDFMKSDMLVLLCALFFAIHILTVDHFSPLADGVKLSCIQFFVCGILSMFPAFFGEMKHSVQGIREWIVLLKSFDVWIPILYAGVLSCGVAYTFQIIGQNGLNPTVASLLMSMESIFSVIAGWLILGEKMNPRQLTGCVLIFAAIMLAQIPVKKSEKSLDTDKT